MATPSLNFRNRAEKGKTRCAQTVPLLFSARLQKFKAPSRAGKGHTVGALPLALRLASHRRPREGGDPVSLLTALAFSYPGTPPDSRFRGSDGVARVWPFLALDGALNFCCGEEKERRLFERSEFASSPSPRQKFKEAFAISGAPFFAYFLWQDKESESAPAGDEARDAPTTANTSPIQLTP
jgi:hypothetical protein